jgi:hypothetical protein
MYTLRTHIELVRTRIGKLRGGAKAAHDGSREASVAQHGSTPTIGGQS